MLFNPLRTQNLKKKTNWSGLVFATQSYIFFSQKTFEANLIVFVAKFLAPTEKKCARRATLITQKNASED